MNALAAIVLTFLTVFPTVVVVRRTGGTTTTTTTSTTTTVSTTSTTTTTGASTTTTTIAGAAYVWAPLGRLPVATTTASYTSAAANEQRCWDWVAPYDASNLDTIAWRMGGAGSSSCSVTLFAAGGASIVRTTGAVSCALGERVNTVSGFNVTGGTEYRLCVCDNAANDGTYVTGNWSDANFGPLLAAAGVTTKQGIAANPCISGAPQSTTGALTAEAAPPDAPLVLLENAP